MPDLAQRSSATKWQARVRDETLMATDGSLEQGGLGFRIYELNLNPKPYKKHVYATETFIGTQMEH